MLRSAGTNAPALGDRSATSVARATVVTPPLPENVATKMSVPVDSTSNTRSNSSSATVTLPPKVAE